MNLNEKNVQWLIYRNRNFKNCFPNIHCAAWGGYEADILYLTESERAWIYEVKISKSDFKADMKKPRHKDLLNRDFSRMIIKPARFTYVINGFEIDVDEIPEYAGLVVVDGFYLRTIKRSPTLYNEKMDEEASIFLRKKIYQRFSSMSIEPGNIYNEAPKPKGFDEFLTSITETV